jgi:hypothetical protein
LPRGFEGFPYPITVGKPKVEFAGNGLLTLNGAKSNLTFRHSLA